MVKKGEYCYATQFKWTAKNGSIVKCYTEISKSHVICIENIWWRQNSGKLFILLCNTLISQTQSSIVYHLIQSKLYYVKYLHYQKKFQVEDVDVSKAYILCQNVPGFYTGNYF